MGSYILPSADNKISISVSSDMEQRKIKLSIKKHSVPRLGLGGLSHKERRDEQLKGQIMLENIARGNIWNRYIYLFEPIPEKNWAIASGATPIGSAVAHPIERSQQKKGEKLKLMIKNQLMDKWFRRDRLHFISNILWLHCRQNEHRLLPSGAIHEN
jgi:hypothetical protein